MTRFWPFAMLTVNDQEKTLDSIALTERTGCPLCDCTDWTMHIDFPDIPVVRCVSCKFMYSQKVLSESDIESSYTDSPSSERCRQGQIVNARNNTWMIDYLLGIETLTSILDIGTGYGFLLEQLQVNKSLKSAGVELSVKDARYGRDQLGLNIINKLLSESGLEKGSFDLVTAFEVIEHTVRPIEFIRELTEYVSVGGHLIIMTDNFESRMVRELGAGFPKWIPDSHISHFGFDTLTRAIKQIPELKIERTLTYSTWEVYLRRFYYKARGVRKTPDQATGLGMSNNVDSADKFRLFWLRKAINRLWLRLNVSGRTDGDVMFFLLRKMH